MFHGKFILSKIFSNKTPQDTRHRHNKTTLTTLHYGHAFDGLFTKPFDHINIHNTKTSTNHSAIQTEYSDGDYCLNRTD